MKIKMKLGKDKLVFKANAKEIREMTAHIGRFVDILEPLFRVTVPSRKVIVPKVGEIMSSKELDELAERVMKY